MCKNVHLAHQATFQGSLTFQGTENKERGEGNCCCSYADHFGCMLVAFAGGNPSGSVPKPPEGHSNPRNSFLLGRPILGESFPRTNLNQREATDKGVNA